MIDRQNYKDITAFIDHQKNVEQKDFETLRNFWISLRHLLQWADNQPLTLAHEKERPTFPVYLLSARNEAIYRPQTAGKPLALATQAKACAYARMFFRWAKLEYPARYKSIRDTWIETLKPRKAAREGAKLEKVEGWTLEDILKVAALPSSKFENARAADAVGVWGARGEKGELKAKGKVNLALLRARAAMCFMYLSGMRVTAFLSLPVSCVDLDKGAIEQNPSKGVLTKFRKAAITSLLPIPELMAPVKEWDRIVRENAPADRRWHCGVNGWGTALKDDGPLSPRQMRGKRNGLVDNMKIVCEMAGVDYKSPHKLRHGHAIYGVKHARNIAELKAVSQNLMHSSIQITDGIYGNLSGDDTRRIIGNLAGGDKTEGGPQADLAALLENPAIRAFIEALQAAQKGRQ